MKNGDHLTGEIKGLSEGVLYVDMEYILGTSSVQWSKVEHLESKQYLLSRRSTDQRFTGHRREFHGPAGGVSCCRTCDGRHGLTPTTNRFLAKLVLAGERIDSH